MAGAYLRDILGIDERRCPQICLREEIRGIINGKPSKWGCDLAGAMREVGDGETIK